MENDTHSGHPEVAPPGFKVRAKKPNWNAYERSPRRSEQFGEQLTEYFSASYGWSAEAAVLREDGECHDPALTWSSGTGRSLAEALEWLDRQRGQYLRGTLPRSATELRERLHADHYWKALTGDALLSFLRSALLLYGSDTKNEDVGPLGRLYQHALQSTDAKNRAQMMSDLSEMPLNSAVSYYVFLPSIVCDPEWGIASTACIDFVSTSPAQPNGHPRTLSQLEDLYKPNGHPRALSELDGLYKMNNIANPGAVFGALIDLGDARFRPFIEQLKSSRTGAELNIAARIFSGYAKHGAITFWLDWAEQLISDSGSGLFGTVACALATIGSRGRDDLVWDTERNYPSGIRVLQKWSKQDYAQLIAPRLYALEKQETPPKTFSKVLECWGLTPKAAKEDRFNDPPGR